VKLRLGTRGSALAMVQSEWLAARLRDSGHDVEIVRIVTEGDVRPPDTLPGEGIFVAAIANALKTGKVDVAVHSAKDVPLEEDPSLCIAAFPERADPRDALVTVSRSGSLASLPPGCRVGTDSPRRAGFVRAARHDVRIVPLHGNVDTRVRRLDAGEVDALVIAAAGLDRLDRAERIDERIDPDQVPPAPAQGALAVQARRSDDEVLRLLATYDRPDIRLEVELERRVLRETGGSCRAPVGALATVLGDGFRMIVGGVNSDGSEKTVEKIEGSRDEAFRLATEAARRLARSVALR
jgi:hydroxymethylbilane synthase